MDKPLSQERLSEDEMESAQHYLKNGFESTFTQVYGARLINEIKRLQAIEADYLALQDIMDRARKMASMQTEQEEQGPRFSMDADGNLHRLY